MCDNLMKKGTPTKIVPEGVGYVICPLVAERPFKSVKFSSGVHIRGVPLGCVHDLVPSNSGASNPPGPIPVAQVVAGRHTWSVHLPATAESSLSAPTVREPEQTAHERVDRRGSLALRNLREGKET
jgi:hypothetical protein